MKNPIASGRISERIGKTIVTVHMTTLASSNVRTGFVPRPRRATAIPPTMNPRLVNAIRMPHASTDIRVSPYGSISAMKTPPRKLLNVENRRSASSPGTRRTAPDRAADVDEAWIALARLGWFLGDADRQEVDARDGGDDHGDEDARPHPELADGEAAEHRGEGEGDPVGGADQPIRPVTALLWDKQGHGRRERDRAEVAGDRAREHEDDERPEGGLAEIPQGRAGRDHER